MELKDVILSTLAEMENETEEKPVEKVIQQESPDSLGPETQEKEEEQQIESELVYLNSIRERLLVLFEGFQAPNNSNLEAKIDMTLNFLEYTLATIDLRIQRLEKGKNE